MTGTASGSIDGFYAASQAVVVRLNIRIGKPGIVGQFGDRAGDDRVLFRARARMLLEYRQDDTATGRFQRPGQALVGIRDGRRAEIDVKKDIAGAGCDQPVDDVGMDVSRPWPGTDIVEALLVDRDESKLARCGTRRVSKAKFDELSISSILFTSNFGAGRYSSIVIVTAATIPVAIAVVSVAVTVVAGVSVAVTVVAGVSVAVTVIAGVSVSVAVIAGVSVAAAIAVAAVRLTVATARFAVTAGRGVGRCESLTDGGNTRCRRRDIDDRGF